MIRVFSYFFLFGLFIVSCQSRGETSGEDEKVTYNDDSIRCPEGKHTDSIVEILYGMPTEESFRKADSGLIVLGGCELPEKPLDYYCKKHSRSF